MDGKTFQSWTKRVKCVSMVTPACRILLVRACAGDDGTVTDDGVDIHPVVAIRNTEFRCYSKIALNQADRDRAGHGPADSDALLLRNGWRYCGPDNDLESIYVDPEFGLCPENFLDSSNTAYEQVVADWPAGQDANRLANVVERVKKAAAAKVASSRREAKRKAQQD